MNIRQLEYFATVAETLNFTKAASRFYISQTAVTQQIKALEQELHIVLFQRNKRHVELTPAGRVFLINVQDILRNLKSAVAQCTAVSTGVTGTICFGVVKDFFNADFVDVMYGFCKAYPNVDVQFIRNTVGNLYEQLLNGKVDIIITVKFHIEKYADIRYKLLRRAPLVAVLPYWHHLAQQEYVTKEELQKERLLLLDTQGNEFDEKAMMLENISEGGHLPQMIQYIKDVETILLLAAIDKGIGLVPAYMPALFKFSDKIRTIPIKGNEKQVEVIWAWVAENRNPALARFLERLS